MRSNNYSTGVLEPALQVSLKKYLLLLFVFLVIEFSPWVGTHLADAFNPYLVFLDPEKVFTWGILHHLFQMLIPLAIMIIWPGRSLRDWGFQWGDYKKGIKWIFWFSIIWSGIYIVLTIINIVYHNTPAVYYDVTNTRNFIGELSFRGLVVGLSEETLFRAFPITILILYWSRKVSVFGFKVSHAGIIAMIFFCYAHIGYHLYPFEIYHFNILQLITAAGLGLLYAIVFENTQSIVYPAIIHSISDVLPVVSLYVLYLVNN